MSSTDGRECRDWWQSWYHPGRNVRFSNLAVLVIYGSSITTADLANWKLIWDVNTIGTLLCYKYAAIQMVKQGSGGRIIGTFSLSFS